MENTARDTFSFVSGLRSIIYDTSLESSVSPAFSTQGNLTRPLNFVSFDSFSFFFKSLLFHRSIHDLTMLRVNRDPYAATAKAREMWLTCGVSVRVCVRACHFLFHFAIVHVDWSFRKLDVRFVAS